MTKEDIEDLAKHLKLCANHELQRYIDVLNKFFYSNVCIPKGENRHPRCDLLHQWAEDTTIKFSAGGREYGEHPWHPSICDIIKNTKQMVNLSARIKPSEPVYEYLWYDVDGDTKWMTFDEAKEFERPWFWVKETKRKRK